MMLIFALVVKKLYYVQFSYFLLFFASEFNLVPTNYPNYTFHIQNSALFSNLGLTFQNFPKSGHLQLADTLLLHRRCPLIGENTVIHLSDAFCTMAIQTNAFSQGMFEYFKRATFRFIGCFCS